MRKNTDWHVLDTCCVGSGQKKHKLFKWEKLQKNNKNRGFSLTKFVTLSHYNREKKIVKIEMENNHAVKFL